MSVFETLEQLDVERCLFITDKPSGLRAVVVLDDLTLGPAAGGVRTHAYDSWEEAVADAHRLAHAMTIKCALAGLEAGGGKAVVLEHPGMDRSAAFAALGRNIERLDGVFRTAGDLGTSGSDLKNMARHTRYVQTDEPRLAKAVATGLGHCLKSALELAEGTRDLHGVRVAIQGCGAIGGAVASHLAESGAELVLADLYQDRAEALASKLGAQVVAADEIEAVEADVFAPCARGQVLNPANCGTIKAKIVCGAANNVFTTEDAGRVLVERGILHVPEALASAGAVIEGIGRTVMGLSDRTPLIKALGATTTEVLKNARNQGICPHIAAQTLAEDRIRNH